jgi:predicted Rossmann-fold nucleotide-binding protein
MGTLRQLRGKAVISGCRREAMRGTQKAVLDEDLAKVGTALRRAAKQARKIAIQTNTPLVIYENGRVIKKKLGREKGR